MLPPRVVLTSDLIRTKYGVMHPIGWWRDLIQFCYHRLTIAALCVHAARYILSIIVLLLCLAASSLCRLWWLFASVSMVSWFSLWSCMPFDLCCLLRTFRFHNIVLVFLNSSSSLSSVPVFVAYHPYQFLQLSSQHYITSCTPSHV